jgi:hypothetical protein
MACVSTQRIALTVARNLAPDIRRSAKTWYLRIPSANDASEKADVRTNNAGVPKTSPRWAGTYLALRRPDREFGGES